MIWNILIVVLLIVTNGFFVAAEFALVKIKLREIKALAHERRKMAKMLEHIILHLDAYLSACQLGITLASLGLGWVGEPLVAHLIEPLFTASGLPADKVHFVAVPIAFLCITLLHITTGEQIPKIYAIEKYQWTAIAVTYPLIIFYRVFKPFIWVINTISNTVLRAMGIHMAAEHAGVHTAEELRAILVESALGGHLTRRERLIMENAMDLENKIARRHMVPRNQIVYLDKRDPVEEKLRKASETGHTRYPLCDGDLEHIIGIVHIKDVFRAMAQDKDFTTLADFARKPNFLLETVTIDVLLRDFQKNNTALTMLVDEYGAVSGMITLENVLEELVGPIQDEFDDEPAQIIKKGPHEFEVDAICLIEEVERKTRLDLPDTTVDTIGGLLVEHFGHIPGVDETLTLGGSDFTVLEAEPTRILRILIKRVDPASPESPVVTPEPSSAQ